MIISIFVLIILAVFFIIVIKKKSLKNISYDIVTEKKELLSLTDVVSFFKQPEILEKIKQSNDNIAVALKEKKDENSFFIVLCIFSKDTTTVKYPLKRFEVSKLNEDLISVFGDKDMIILG